MQEWVKFYERVLGFSLLVQFDDKDISTEYTALMSKVVQDGRGRIKLPINEPARGKRRSQIDEYLRYSRGAWRPAYRDGHRRHHRHRPRDAE